MAHRLLSLPHGTNSALGHGRTPWHRLRRHPVAMLLRMPWPLFLATLAAIYTGEVLLFGILFAADPAGLRGEAPMGLPASLVFAMQNLFVASLSSLEVTSPYTLALATLELVVGLITTSLVTGLVFLRFTRVEAPLRFSRSLCITALPGGHLLCRFLSQDPSHWLNVSYGLFLLVDEAIESGLLQRRVHPLPLLNACTPQLHLTATLAHPLGPESPLVRLGREGLERGRAAVIAMVEGSDEVTGTPLLQVQHYGMEDLRFDHVFADLVREDGSGGRMVDPGALDRLRPLVRPIAAG
jgi:inward rectifier potassium channel